MARTPRILALLLAFPLAFVLAAGPAPAADEPSATAVEPVWSGELVDELMSPYCPGRTLRSCPSDKAGELIQWIEEQEASGRGRQEVYAQLLGEFGEEIRQAPEVTGFGAAAYLVPVLAFFAGGLLVAVFLRRQAARPRAAGAVAAHAPALCRGPSDPELERRVDEELGRSR